MQSPQAQGNIPQENGLLTWGQKFREDAPVLLTGLYAWTFTVFPLLGAQPDTFWSKLLGVSGALALLSSPWVPRGRWFAFAAIDLFVGTSLLVWWLNRDFPSESPFAHLGALGWLAYSLALGSLSSGTKPHEGVMVHDALRPRVSPSRLSVLVLVLVTFCSLFLLMQAWAVDRPKISVLAHLLALATSLLLLQSGASLATYLQVERTNLAAPLRLTPALIPLAFTFALALGGLFWTFGSG